VSIEQQQMNFPGSMEIPHLTTLRPSEPCALGRLSNQNAIDRLNGLIFQVARSPCPLPQIPEM